MAHPSIFGRTAIIEFSKRLKKACTYEEVTEAILKDESLVEPVIAEWKNLLIVDKSGITINQIRQYWDLANEKCGHTLTNLFIDYVGLISGTDDYEGISKVARGLKIIAKQLNTRVICVVQLSRAAKDGTIPVTMDMLRDSGALEESADYIVGLWHSILDASRIHGEFIKIRFGDRGTRFDLINTGLYYTTTEYKDG
jgi:hypothetical protein